MSGNKPKILVIDDEASVRRILEIRLGMVGYDVVTAADGLEALAVYRHQVPDLVVLDVKMPDLDSFGVYQALRRELGVPIIMLTARADATDRLTGLELGADDYMVKPFSPKELESCICRILRRVGKTCTKSIPTNRGVIQVGSLLIGTNKRQVYKGDSRIRLAKAFLTCLV